MEQPEFRLIIENDKKTGAILAVYFQVRRGKVAQVCEVVDGTAFANYDRKGRLIGVELLAPCQVAILAQLVKKEPEQHRNRIKRFFKDSIPRKMALAT